MSTDVKITDVSPVLPTNDLKVTLEYYKKLGFNVDWTWPDEGPARHAGLSIGYEGEGEDHGHDHVHLQLYQADASPVPNSGWMYFGVPEDIDTLYEHFKDAGADITSELQDHEWGMREFSIKDNNGHSFRFGQGLNGE